MGDNTLLCMVGFALGMCGWAFILFEIFAGESAQACPQDAHVKQAFETMKLIVSLGWSIYPAGYFFGTISSVASAEALNVIYNIAFVLCCWSCAKSAREGVAIEGKVPLMA